MLVAQPVVCQLGLELHEEFGDAGDQRLNGRGVRDGFTGWGEAVCKR
jgi:hypothetical protein